MVIFQRTSQYYHDVSHQNKKSYDEFEINSKMKRGIITILDFHIDGW